MNSRYDTLNKSIGEVNEKIGTTNTNLRQELEIKINTKLDTVLFKFALAGLCSIASVFYYLSYKDLIESAQINKNDITDLKVICVPNFQDSEHIKLEKPKQDSL